jgi:hypothetical protein
VPVQWETIGSKLTVGLKTSYLERVSLSNDG